MSEDPKEIIRTEDNKKRAQNLREDLPVWLLISEMNPSSSLIKIDLDKNQNYKISYKNKKTGFFQERFATLCEKVFRVRADEYQIKKKSEIKIENVIDFAKKLVAAPREIQLEFCRKPKQQNNQEKTQNNMLKTFLDETFWNVEPLTPGEKCIDHDKIVPLKDVRSSNKRDYRSIDVLINTKNLTQNYIFYGFNKFIEDQGSLQSHHQIEECKRYLEAAKKYCELKQGENTFFFCVSDGKEAERLESELKRIIYPFEERIFIGNTTQIVKIFEEYEKKLQNN